MLFFEISSPNNLWTHIDSSTLVANFACRISIVRYALDTMRSRDLYPRTFHPARGNLRMRCSFFWTKSIIRKNSYKFSYALSWFTSRMTSFKRFKLLINCSLNFSILLIFLFLLYIIYAFYQKSQFFFVWNFLQKYYTAIVGEYQISQILLDIENRIYMAQKQFSIAKTTQKKWETPPIQFFIYSLLFLVFFRCFSIYSNVTNILFGGSTLDIFTKDLQTLSAYFLPIDKEVSHELYTLDSIVKSYMKWENIFKTKKSEIEEVRYYIINNQNYLSSLGFQRYESLMKFLSDLYDYRDEVYELMWENETFNYIIPLQNGNEKRPNGGFFGSFAFVTLSGGHIENLEVIDSYLADYIAPASRIDLPLRYSEYFWVNQLWFIAGNKFWFTDMDWKNLKTLYEKAFNEEYEMDKVREMYSWDQRKLLHDKYIKWVIFLDSNLLVELLPWFVDKMREWQFINASIDIIRGEERWNKKELYIAEVLDYFTKNSITIAKNLINNRDEVLNKRYIQIYLSDMFVSQEFRDMIARNNLNTRFQWWKIYARDINIANNKSDWFVSKWLRLYSSSWALISSQYNDVISLEELPVGEYQLVIDYSFFVPESYRNFIHGLEKKYNIELTPREEWILVLNPVNQYEGDIERMWWNRWFVYYPRNITVTSVEWDVQDVSYFQSDFAQWLNYSLRTIKSQDQLQAVINFRIN